MGRVKVISEKISQATDASLSGVEEAQRSDALIQENVVCGGEYWRSHRVNKIHRGSNQSLGLERSDWKRPEQAKQGEALRWSHPR